MTTFWQKVLAGVTTAATAYATRKFGPEGAVVVSVGIGALTSWVAHHFHMAPAPASTDDVGNP